MFQLDMFHPDSDWHPPRMIDLPSWAGAKKVSLDVETKDPNLKELGPGTMRRDGYVVGLSLAFVIRRQNDDRTSSIQGQGRL